MLVSGAAVRVRLGVSPEACCVAVRVRVRLRGIVAKYAKCVSLSYGGTQMVLIVRL